MEGISGGLFAKLREARFNAGDIPAEGVQPRRLLKLGARLLQPQIKNFLADIPAVREQFRLGFFLNLFSL